MRDGVRELDQVIEKNWGDFPFNSCEFVNALNTCLRKGVLLGSKRLHYAGISKIEPYMWIYRFRIMNKIPDVQATYFTYIPWDIS